MTDFSFIADIIERHLEKLGKSIEKVLVEKKISNTGFSKEFLIEKTGTSVKLLGANYLYYLDKGRGPGKFPPVNVLKDWIKQKLGVPDSEINSAAYLIGRKIANEGTGIYKDKSLGIQLDILVDAMMNDMYRELAEQAAIKAILWD